MRGVELVSSLLLTIAKPLFARLKEIGNFTSSRPTLDAEPLGAMGMSTVGMGMSLSLSILGRSSQPLVHALHLFLISVYVGRVNNRHPAVSVVPVVHTGRTGVLESAMKKVVRFLLGGLILGVECYIVI